MIGSMKMTCYIDDALLFPILGVVSYLMYFINKYYYVTPVSILTVPMY